MRNFRLEFIQRNLETLEGAQRLTPETKDFLSHVKDIGADKLSIHEFNELQERAEALHYSRQEHKNLREKIKRGSGPLTLARYSRKNVVRNHK